MARTGLRGSELTQFLFLVLRLSESLSTEGAGDWWQVTAGKLA